MLFAGSGITGSGHWRLEPRRSCGLGSHKPVTCLRAGGQSPFVPNDLCRSIDTFVDPEQQVMLASAVCAWSNQTNPANQPIARSPISRFRSELPPNGFEGVRRTSLE